MADTKHTPGPWLLKPDDVLPSDKSIDIYTDDHNWVAVALGSHVGQKTEEQILANAKLISAAPDMFEVIKELYDWSIASDIRGSIFPKLEAAYLKATT
jgi:hypothetical protein